MFISFPFVAENVKQSLINIQIESFINKYPIPLLTYPVNPIDSFADRNTGNSPERENMKQAKQHKKTQIRWVVTLDNNVVSMRSKELAENEANYLLKLSGAEGVEVEAEAYLI